MFEQELTKARTDLQSLQRQQADKVAFGLDNRWRHDRMAQLEHTLNSHWTTAVLGAARDGHPYAYGPNRLKAARADLIDHVEQLGQPATGRSPVTDPLQALADLDRAVREHPPTAPPRRTNSMTHRRPFSRPDVHRTRQMYQHLSQTEPVGPAPPSRSIDL